MKICLNVYMYVCVCGEFQLRIAICTQFGNIHVAHVASVVIFCVRLPVD